MKYSTCGYIEKNGQWLMLLRNRKPDDVNAGKYIGVGGKLEKNETPRMCMCREIQEETGLMFSLDEPVYRGLLYFHYPEAEEEKIWIYSLVTDQEADMNCPEGTLCWVKKEDILKLDLWEGDRIFLKGMLEENREVFCLDLYYDDKGRLLKYTERRAEDE